MHMFGLRAVLLGMAASLSTGFLIPVQIPTQDTVAAQSALCPRPHGLLRLQNRAAGQLRMSEGDGKESDLAELIKERERLQKETDELMKRRQDLLKQDVAKLMSKSQEPAKDVAQTAKSSSNTEKTAESSKGTAVDLFGNAKTDPEKKDGEAKRTTRGGFLRAFAIGTAFTGVTFLAAILLSYPRLEKLAYIQFSTLFEQGALAFTNKLRKAIDSQDFATAMELTKPQGELEVEILQPMVFWAAGNADADPEYLKELETVLADTKNSLDKIYSAAQSNDAAAAGKSWDAAKASLARFVLLANQRIPADIPPLSGLF